MTRLQKELVLCLAGIGIVFTFVSMVLLPYRIIKGVSTGSIELRSIGEAALFLIIGCGSLLVVRKILLK